MLQEKIPQDEDTQIILEGNEEITKSRVNLFGEKFSQLLEEVEKFPMKSLEPRLHLGPWYHSKLYTRHNGEEEDVQLAYYRDNPEGGCWENPKERKIFYSSRDSRFGLKSKKEMVYLSNDPHTARFEALPQSKNKKVPQEIVDDDVNGKDTDDPNDPRCDWTLAYHLSDSILLLDVREDSYIYSFCNHQMKRDIQKITAEVCKRYYPFTQKLAGCAFKSGFHGILYTSAKFDPGWNMLSKECIALWSREHLKSVISGKKIT